MKEQETEYFQKNVRTLSNDPQYFGGYFNMARHNIFIISNNTAEKHGKISLLVEEGHIPNSFLCNKENNKINWNQVFAITDRFMPILKVFDSERLPKENTSEVEFEGKNFNLMSNTLKVLFSGINEFRNDYSHYYSTEKGTKRKDYLSEGLAKFIKENFLRAIEYTKMRFRDVFTDEDYDLVQKFELVEDDLRITEKGMVFLICMFLEREYAFQFISKITGLKGTQYKSFLVARNVLMAFCVKLPNDRFISDSPRQAMTLDIINTLGRCPKELYEAISEEDRRKFSPKIDSTATKNILENSVSDNEEIDDFEVYIESITKKVRHRNRFSDFALKFIDETEAMGNWRFQIDLGKVVLDEYKKLLHNEEQERKVVDNAMAFGKLNDLYEKDKEQLQINLLNKINKTDEPVIFDQFAPYYNVKGNKIGISARENIAIIIPSQYPESKVKISIKQPQPEAFLSLKELSKVILLDFLKKGEATELITQFIDRNNKKIVNRDFIDTIKSSLPPEWEIFYKRTGNKNEPAYFQKTLNELESRKVNLDKVLDEHGLNHRQIPGRILDYWLNIQDVSIDRQIAKYIQSMKKDCIERVKALNKFRKERKGKIPKIGEMATFLAKDIVDMVIDQEKKRKITSFYYGKMQEYLALYADPEKRKLFISLIKDELNLFEAGGHPFLKEIKYNEINSTIDLYETYLIEKAVKKVVIHNGKNKQRREKDISWIYNTFYTLKWSEKANKKLVEIRLPEDKENIPYCICKLAEKSGSFDDKWLKNIIEGSSKTDKRKPIDLPTNLFDNRLIELLKEELETNQINYSENANLNLLFKLWWCKVREDKPQPFYKSRREYTIYDEKVSFELDSKEQFSDYYQGQVERAWVNENQKRQNERRTKPKLPNIDRKQVEKVFRNTIGGNEKLIRITQEEDRLMFLIFEQLLDSTENLKLKLSNIDGLLNETIIIKQKVDGEIGYGEDKNPISRIITANRKRKDYTILKKYVYDRRLPALFEYFSSEEISLDILKFELDSYNKSKQIVFDSAFSLEETIVNNDRQGLEQLFVDENNQVQEGNIEHKPYLDWLRRNNLADENLLEFLRWVRNSFSHNEFPCKEKMDLMIREWENSNFAMQIAEVYKEKIEEIRIKL